MKWQLLDAADPLALTLGADTPRRTGHGSFFEFIYFRVSVVSVDVWGLGTIVRCQGPLGRTPLLVLWRCSGYLLPGNETFAVFFELCFVIYELAFYLDRLRWCFFRLIILRHVLIPVGSRPIGWSSQYFWATPQLRRKVPIDFLLRAIVCRVKRHGLVPQMGGRLYHTGLLLSQSQIGRSVHQLRVVWLPYHAVCYLRSV